MSKTSDKVILFAAISLIISCAKNREDEYRPRTDTNNWIVEKMSDVYLWNEAMRTSGNPNAIPEIFFPTVLTSNANGGRSDTYSFIDVTGNTDRLIKNNESYGFEYFTETVEGKAISARVLMVYRNSPAQKAGLKRGDRITAVNGIKLTTDNLASIDKGSGGKFQISNYRQANSISEENGKPQYVWEIVDTLDMTASAITEYNPIYIDSIYSINGKNIGYLVINNARISGETTNQTNALSQAVDRIKNCDEIIIDIRYNYDSDIRYITELASMMYGNGSTEDIFLTKKHNSNHSGKDSTIHFTNNYPGSRINMKKLHFIISDKTAMEAEAMLRRLSELMEIHITGINSAGKNVMLQPFVNPQYTQYVIYPVVSFYSALNEDTNNFSPIQVNVQANEKEKTIEKYKEIGDTAEIMLKSCINSIFNPDSGEEE